MLKQFIDNYPFGKLSDKQKAGLEFIIHKLEQSSIQQQKQQAYVLATIKHECAERWEPITELGSMKYLMDKPYYPFIGRGYVQITWQENYQRFGKLLNIDLVTNPLLALRPEISWRIAELGMTKGLFTGKKLSDYFDDEVSDFYNARRIINKLDKAVEIKEVAEKIFFIISGIHPKDIPEPKPLEIPPNPQP